MWLFLISVDCWTRPAWCATLRLKSDGVEPSGGGLRETLQYTKAQPARRGICLANASDCGPSHQTWHTGRPADSCTNPRESQIARSRGVAIWHIPQQAQAGRRFLRSLAGSLSLPMGQGAHSLALSWHVAGGDAATATVTATDESLAAPPTQAHGPPSPSLRTHVSAATR